MILDTQALFWLAQSPENLSQRARVAIRSAQSEGRLLAISDKTLWELAMMIQRGVLNPAPEAPDFLESVERWVRVLPITASVARRSTQFSDQFPKDPADRIIAATALVNGVPLVTADQKIRKSGEVPCIW